MRNLQLRTIGATLALAVLAPKTFAQAGNNGWYYECIDPKNTAPYSSPFGVASIEDEFVGIARGAYGSVTYGGQTGPCYAPTAVTENFAGRFAMYAGSQGSAQTTFDDGMAFTTGAPIDAAGDFFYAAALRYPASDTKTTDKTVYLIDDKLSGYYTGASKRYMITIFYEAGKVQATAETRIVGDAVRFHWTLQNLDTNSAFLGLRWGATMGKRTRRASDTDSTGANQADSGLPGANSAPKAQVTQQDGTSWISFITTPTTKPIRSEKNFLSTDSNFPGYVSFSWGQAYPYGIRVDNVPYPETPDATKADQFKIGNWGTTLRGNVFNNRVFTDTGSGDPILDSPHSPVVQSGDTLLGQTAMIQTFAPQVVAAGQSRDIIYYLRSPWSTADYRDPYATVLDAPPIVATGSGTNGLTPNPMTVYAYVDNQYATLEKEVPLTNVRMTIAFPEGTGLALASGEAATKTISYIAPNTTGTISWSVVADGKHVGNLPYSVSVSPSVGPARTVSSNILVSATPTTRIAQGPNLLTFPWNFGDTSLDSILGLRNGVDYLAYRWSPDLGEYTPTLSTNRGDALWIVPSTDHAYITLKGATAPADTNLGGLTTVLRPGWNMIGNPYQYPVILSQLVGVAEDSPSNSLTWQDLVDSQFVSGSLAYWQRNAEDPNSGTYAYTAGASDILAPGVGYWIYVNSFKPVKLIWPASYSLGLPDSTRSRSTSATAFTTSSKQWRLQLSARNVDGMDAYNYIGIVSSDKAAQQLQIQKPPTSPNAKVELAVVQDTLGKTSRLAQALTSQSGRSSWKVMVNAKTAGDVSVTWPNLSTIPRNVGIQITDVATNTTRDLRFASGYTFHTDQPTTREFRIDLTPGIVTRAVITDAVVTRPTRDPRAPFAISYTLSGQALTTIRVLGGGGKEIYTVSRGRADNPGQNSATWSMRDNANRAVAPGVYQVEIVAETQNGERVRKIVPINVVR